MYLSHQPPPRYERIRLLDQGATGSVYLGRRLTDNALVALKYLRAVNYTGLWEFQREANNYYRQQNCQFVVDLLDYNFSSTEPYLVLEYCQYGSARQFVPQLRWQEEKIAALLTHAAAGIESIHAGGGVHRDIKPDNLLVTRTENGHLIMKVNDFGLARLPSKHALSFMTSTLVGTPGYIAPEVLAGKTFTQAADICSFGVTIHELFTGIRPSAGSEQLSCPKPLLKLVGSMLAVDPQDRPTIEEVRKELVQAATAMKSQKQVSGIIGVTIVGVIVAALLNRKR